jgi:hypothetical protein
MVASPRFEPTDGRVNCGVVRSKLPIGPFRFGLESGQRGAAEIGFAGPRQRPGVVKIVRYLRRPRQVSGSLGQTLGSNLLTYRVGGSLP